MANKTLISSENGFVPVPRKQWAVIVCGSILEYEEKSVDFSCGCLLAPELPESLKRKPSFCNTDCRVKIQYRQYLDCTRREVLEYLIDFEVMHTIPREVLEYKRGRKIMEFELLTRTDPT